jgi:restriction system protein
MVEKTVWGIHGGRHGVADGLFLSKSVIAVGWREMGDVSGLAADRPAFRAAVEKTYPGRTPAQISASFGQIFRFVHELKIGDIVVYPSKIDRQIHIGEVTGKYQFRPDLDPSHPQTRTVKWIKHLARTAFSQGALYESGSALTFFQIKTYPEEFLAALEGKSAPEAPVSADTTVAAVAEDIEESTRDFILKRLAQELKGHPFADFVAHLLSKMGYRTRVSPEGPDGGVDIVAHHDELGFEPPIIKVQVKSSEGSIGDPIVSALYGKVSAGEFGLLVTLGTFTPQAKMFARSKSNLRLVDGAELVDLVLAHYEQFESRYKGLLPLKRVFVPEPIEDTE